MTNIRILVVEDEEACRETVRTLLERAGAAVITLDTAEAAVDFLRRETVDAVITDIRLPGMDGISLLRSIRDRDPDIPVIIITGYSSVGSAVDALTLGAQDYLLKPFEDPERLVRSVLGAVQHYRLAMHNAVLQEELRVSEERFRTLFENASDMIFVFEVTPAGKTLAIEAVNHVACRELGFARNRMRERTLSDLVVPEQAAALRKALRKFHRDHRVTFETLLLNVDGRRLPVEISMTGVTLSGRPRALVVARDISRQREWERRIVDAGERDRRTLGQELHDVLAQDLSSIDMLASVIEKALPPRGVKLRKDMRLMRTVSRRAVAFCRRLSAGLFPTELDEAGLTEALRRLVDSQHRMGGRRFRFKGAAGLSVPDRSAALHLYRIAQQALHNAIQHSEARQFTVSLRRSRGTIVLTVEDNGKGFHISPDNGAGMGLNIMQYRAGLIHAGLDIGPRPGGGTRVICTWQPERTLEPKPVS